VRSQPSERRSTKRGGGSLSKKSIIYHPIIDDALRTELAQKDITTDESLRDKFLPRMNEAYRKTLNGTPDNIADYKFFVDKVVSAIPELQRYDQPYVYCSLHYYFFNLIYFVQFSENHF